MPDDPQPTMPGIIAARASAIRRKMRARLAGAYPPVAAAVVVAIGLLAHELAYHLTGGTDFPLVLLASGTRVLVVSHGGLDALGVGALVIVTLCMIELAKQRESAS